MIVAAVTLYGLTASPVARLLGVTRLGPAREPATRVASTGSVTTLDREDG